MSPVMFSSEVLFKLLNLIITANNSVFKLPLKQFYRFTLPPRLIFDESG